MKLAGFARHFVGDVRRHYGAFGVRPGRMNSPMMVRFAAARCQPSLGPRENSFLSPLDSFEDVTFILHYEPAAHASLL
jgi:hypothetical protein